MKYLVVSLLAVEAAVVVLFLAGLPTAAFLVGVPGTGLLMLGFLLYIAIWDSRSRWPGVSFPERLSRIMFFRR